MDYQTLTRVLADGQCVITLNRPDVMNALDAQMRAEITHAVGTAAGDGARVVVITGAGRAFCSGQDLGDGARLSDMNLEAILRDEYIPMIMAIRDCPLPVIAAVNGAAAGAGASLALACDVVIAAHSAAFIQAFTRIGLMPDAGVTWILPRLVGQARAMGLSLFAEAVSAQEAAAMGMIFEAVTDAEFPAHWQARAAQIAQGPTQSYRRIKAALAQSAQNGLEAQMLLEGQLQGEIGKTRDAKEGILAFGQKRPPAFEGR